MPLNVLSDKNNSVDWWFMYKLPEGIAPSTGTRKTKGSEYLYFDSASDDPLALSDHILGTKKGALAWTLAPIYKQSPSDSLGWICYNDEPPEGIARDSEKGHSKGVLVFDLASDTAFWLLHSWPKFADPKSGAPASWDYGQTYLCIALKDVDTARAIAKTMLSQQEPQTYQCHLPTALDPQDPLVRVSNAVDVNETDPPADLAFSSAGGQTFRLMAKNRHWAKDFWIDLVGPKLDVDMEVETWRRGTVPGTEDSNDTDDVTDVLYLDASHLGAPYEWHYTKDHSKWGTSVGKDWVCVGDINRQTSQEKRGGGAICFQNQTLHDNLAKMEKLKQ